MLKFLLFVTNLHRIQAKSEIYNAFYSELYIKRKKNSRKITPLFEKKSIFLALFTPALLTPHAKKITPFRAGVKRADKVFESGDYLLER